MTAQGRCLAAREFRERLKNHEKCDFLEVQNGENAFFCSEHRKFMKMIQKRRNFGNPFVSSEPRSSKVGYFDVN